MAVAFALLIPATVVGGPVPHSTHQWSGGYSEAPFCEATPWLCTDSPIPYEGKYVGHDEPSLLFYSTTAGSGNSAIYRLTIPSEAPTRPDAPSTPGTWNFELMPAFWFGMAMCDDQSAPESGTPCTPDSDTNIYTNTTDPNDPRFIGKHPGGAYMELQFYPPGWVTSDPTLGGGDPDLWTAALTIDEYSFDQNHDVQNNQACLNQFGQEPVHFAPITLDGTPNGTHLKMAAGDSVVVEMQDTSDGFQVVLDDLTSGQKGSMTASGANGFKQVMFQPNACTCTAPPFNYHPMYSTSQPLITRLTWTAHSYNVAASTELGHFEQCDSVSSGSCTSPGPQESGGIDNDDFICFPPSGSINIQIGGCIGNDVDFDGPAYQLEWPGSNSSTDAELHPQPIVFTSPVFLNSGVETNYDQIGFETNLPLIEAACRVNGTCQNPPVSGGFYPIYTTGTQGSDCVWQLGGAAIPGTTNTFGDGTSTTEYSTLFSQAYPSTGGVETLKSDYRQGPIANPCSAPTNLPTPSAAAVLASIPARVTTSQATPPSARTSLSYFASRLPRALAIEGFSASSRKLVASSAACVSPTPTPSAALTFSSQKIVFQRRIGVGSSSAPKTVKVANHKNRRQNTPVTINSVSASPSNEFSVTSSCVKTIAPGEVCEFQITFTPTAIGKQSGTLEIDSTASNPKLLISITGTGKAAPQ